MEFTKVLTLTYMQTRDKLEPECYYHIYNRAVGNELLFIESDDYQMFFEKLKKFLGNVIDIYSYCLLPNHFHLLVKINSEEKLGIPINEEQKNYNAIINQKFSNFFNSYTRTFNKNKQRKGKLFMLPYKRKKIKDQFYFTRVITYIHRNPIHHHLVKNMEKWKYSSYNNLLSDRPTLLKREDVINWFGDKSAFIECHKHEIEEYLESVNKLTC